MRQIHRYVRVLIVVGIAIGATGCAPQVNDLISGGMKLANGQVGALTAAELKAVSDTVLGVAGAELGQNFDPLTLEQAQALVVFLQVNGIETFDDIEAFVAQAEQDPSVIQGLDDLAAAFPGAEVNFDEDNFDPRQLENLLRSLFGGMVGSGGGSGGGTGGGNGTGGNQPQARL